MRHELTLKPDHPSGAGQGPAHAEDTQYLRVFIGQLRQKIEADPSTPRLILTQPGVGYRFMSE